MSRNKVFISTILFFFAMTPVHSAPPVGHPKLLEASGKVYPIKDYISEGSPQNEIGKDINNNVGTKLLENTLKTEGKVDLVFPGDPGYRSVNAAQPLRQESSDTRSHFPPNTGENSQFNFLTRNSPAERKEKTQLFSRSSFSSKRMFAIDSNGKKVCMKSRFITTDSGLSQEIWYLPEEMGDAYKAKGIYEMNFRSVVGGKILTWKSSSKPELYSKSVTVPHQVRDEATPQIPKVKKRVRFQLDNENVNQLVVE